MRAARGQIGWVKVVRLKMTSERTVCLGFEDGEEFHILGAETQKARLHERQTKCCVTEQKISDLQMNACDLRARIALGSVLRPRQHSIGHIPIWTILMTVSATEWKHLQVVKLEQD